MTHDIYAMFPEAAYLVVTSNDAEHGLDFAETILKKMNVHPHGLAAIIRGEHKINAELRSLSDLKTREGV